MPSAFERLQDGDRVTHDRHGLGNVIRVIDDHEVSVHFNQDPEGTTRTVSHLKLTKL